MNSTQAASKWEMEAKIISRFNKENNVLSRKTVVDVGQKGARHEFDIYSPDKFIGGISTSPWTNKTPRHSSNSGGQDRVSTELLWLNLWEGKERRIVVLTDREMAERLYKKWRGCAFSYPIGIIHYESGNFETIGTL